jgi:heme-degrading monooxygenase HmoA
MIATIWRFHVRPDAVAAFESAYGARGDWARLFERQDGYDGTELLRLDGAAPVYLTIDRWRDRAAFERAKQAFADDYAELDRRCEALTSEETWLGLHAVVD